MAVPVWYVDGSAGNDDNGGSSEGSSIVSGADGDTDGTATVDLSGDTPDLSGVSVGDAIRINGRADGIKSTDVFEITAVDDGADTVDVTPSPAATAGQTWVIGGAFATIQRGADIVNHQDSIVAVKNSVTYEEVVTIPADNFVFQKFEGYGTTLGDNELVIMDGTSTLASGFVTSGDAVVIKNFHIKLFTADGIAASSHDSIILIRCRLDTNGVHGVRCSNQSVIYKCHIHNSGAQGILCLATTKVIDTFTQDNTLSGIECSTGSVVINCISVGDGDNGIDFNGGDCMVYGCTVDGDGKTTTNGINHAPATGAVKVVLNTVVHDCTVGIKGLSATSQGFLSHNNLLSPSNGDAYDAFATQEGELLAAPAFQDEAGGDYTPGLGSPLENAGGDAADAPGTPTTRGDNPWIGAIKDQTVPSSVRGFDLGLYIKGHLP